MGAAPSIAARWLRIGDALPELPVVDAHAVDGAIPPEHLDAIVKGMTHIGRRHGEPLDDELRQECVTGLLSQFFSGATPAAIDATARALGNSVAGSSDSAVPAAHDRTINTLDLSQVSDGRIKVSGDVDVVVGEKLQTALDALSKPRPQPDGIRDPRTPTQRRADALETLVDIVARTADGGTGLSSVGDSGVGVVSAPKIQVAVTIPAGTPDLSALQFFGPVTATTARLLSCDAALSVVIVDGEAVPMELGRETRLFTRQQRRALYLRDGCCIKCGAPAAWTHAHHLLHWADGGDTSIDNGCLLCPGCHDAVHHHGWETYMGPDKHPWLRPPVSVDPRRRPIPAYNRRGVGIDDLPIAS